MGFLSYIDDGGGGIEAALTVSTAVEEGKGECQIISPG